MKPLFEVVGSYCDEAKNRCFLNCRLKVAHLPEPLPTLISMTHGDEWEISEIAFIPARMHQQGNRLFTLTPKGTLRPLEAGEVFGTA